MRKWGKKKNRRARERIFILDDDQAIVLTLTRLMRGFGYSAQGFTNSGDARTGMERRAPDLLISDITMPGISGIEFAIEVTERFPSCKVLLFSARMDAHELVEDMARHGYSFAVAMKPLHPEELIERVRRILAPHEIAPHPIAPQEIEGSKGRRRRPPFGFSPPLHRV